MGNDSGTQNQGGAAGAGASGGTDQGAGTGTGTDTKGLEKKVQELLGEVKTLRAKVKPLEDKAAEADTAKAQLSKAAELAKLLGVDITTADPEKEKQRRDSESRAAAERTSMITDSVTDALLEAGRPIKPGVRRAITMAALNDPRVSAADGKVTGIAEFLTDFSDLVGGGAAQGASHKFPAGGDGAGKDKGQGGQAGDKFQGVENWEGLQKLGLAAVIEFQKANPEKYEQLHKAFNKSLGQARFPRSA